MTSTGSPELLQHQQTLYESRNPTRRWLHCSRRDLIVDWIERKVPKGAAAIEVGPGSGVYLPVLARRFDRVLALDCERVYLENAESLRAQFPNIEARVDDVTGSSTPSASTDFVLCTEVVEHIRRSDLALAEIRRVLKTGGLLLLSTPQRWSILETTARMALSPVLIGLTRVVYREPVLEMGHINLMTASTVRKQLATAGFEVLETYKSGLYVPLVAELCGTLGTKVLQATERGIRNTPLDFALWTQFYLARAI